MTYPSINFLNLLACVQHYSQSLNKNAEVTQKLQKSLIDCINTLSHQDFVTALPSGDNLFTYLTLQLHKNGLPAHPHQMILTALIQRILDLHLTSPQEFSSMIFLLTSANKKNQTPLYIIELLQRPDLLDFYLDLVDRHISKNFMTHPSVIYHNPGNVSLHYQTPWLCTLNHARVFFNQEDTRGFRLLDKLAKPLVTGNQFIAALDVLRAASIKGCISNNEYKNLMIHHLKIGHSLLHELALAGHVDKYHAYLNHIERMLQAHIIDMDEYKSIFHHINKSGFSAAHQSINAPSVQIAHYFLHWLENHCTLPAKIRRAILTISSKSEARMLPRRNPQLHQDACIVNQKVSKLRKCLAIQICAENNQAHTFFSTGLGKALVIDTTSDSSASSPGSVVSDDTHAWSPWNSPLIYSGRT